MKRLHILLAAALGAGSVSAQTEREPSDIELKSAYCTKVLLAFTKPLPFIEGMSAEAIERVKKLRATRLDNLNRLQSYLLPKLDKLNTTALAAATKRAELDISASGNAAVACMEDCATRFNPAEQGARFNACVSTCSGSDAADARLKTCDKVDWLPF